MSYLFPNLTRYFVHDLQNTPADLKLEEEVIRVPVRSPTESQVKAPADETAV